jgi:hypothetical protein
MPEVSPAKLILRPHPAASWNRSLERRIRVILLAILGGLLLSGLVAVALWAIVIRGTAEVSDLSLLFPVLLVAMVLVTVAAHRHLAARPAVRLERDRLTVWSRGLNPFTLTVHPLRRGRLLPVGLLQDPQGLCLILQEPQGPVVRLPLAVGVFPALAAWLLEGEGPVTPAVRERLEGLRKAFVEPADWPRTEASPRLDFLFSFSLPFAFRRLLAAKPEPTADDLERFYRMSRVGADFLYLHELAGEVSRLLPGFALPREDAFRIACVLRVRTELERALAELESVETPEELPKELVTRWKTHLKYHDLSAPPYSGLATRLLSGVAHFAQVSPEGDIHTRDGDTHVNHFVAVRYTEKWMNTSPLEVIDLAGRVMRVNQDEAATCTALRLAAPHILHLHVASYMAFRDRWWFARLKKKMNTAV